MISRANVQISIIISTSKYERRTSGGLLAYKISLPDLILIRKVTANSMPAVITGVTERIQPARAWLRNMVFLLKGSEKEADAELFRGGRKRRRPQRKQQELL